jgi:hypothetical protein
MVIALVRVQIDEIRTRKICLKALMNLISVPKNEMTMLKEGLLWALTSLSQLDDEESMYICAMAFCNISSKTDSRLQLTNIKGSGGAGTVLRFILDLTRAQSMATKLFCVQALINMLSEEENATMLLQNHVFERMKPLVLMTNAASNGIQGAAMKVLGKVACFDKICRWKALEMKVVSLFETMCFSEDRITQESAIVSLFHLTYNKDSAEEVIQRNAERTLLYYSLGQKVELTSEQSALLNAAERGSGGANDVLLNPRSLYQVIKDMRDERYQIMSCKSSSKVFLVHKSSLRIPIDQLSVGEDHVLTDSLHHIVSTSLQTKSVDAHHSLVLWKMCLYILHNVTCFVSNIPILCRQANMFPTMAKLLELIDRENGSDAGERLELDSLRSVFAEALYNLSCDESSQLLMVERGAVTILHGLWRNGHMKTKANCVDALCNLVQGRVNSSKFVEQGGATPLIHASTHAALLKKQGIFEDSPKIGLDSETKRFTFAKILQKLATPPGNQAMLVQQGISEALLSLMLVSLPSNLFDDVASEAKARLVLFVAVSLLLWVWKHSFRVCVFCTYPLFPFEMREKARQG